MNEMAQFAVLRQDASLAAREVVSRSLAGVSPVLLEEIIHELRQPLGVIDSLAYYLELTSADEKICAHLEKIRAMVNQANHILERASQPEGGLHSGKPYVPGS